MASNFWVGIDRRRHGGSWRLFQRDFSRFGVEDEGFGDGRGVRGVTVPRAAIPMVGKDDAGEPGH